MDLLASTAVAMVDMFSKCSEEFDSLCGGDVCELGIRMTEECDEV